MNDTNDTARHRKTVRVKGLEFTVHSSRERSCAVGGRHFFAVGRNCAGWTLFEHAESIVETATACIGRKFEPLADSEDLVTEIRRLVETGDKLPADRRPPWQIDADYFNECLRIAECRRNTKAQAKAEERQKVQDAKHARWMKQSGLDHCTCCLTVSSVGSKCPTCGTPI
uniref:Uncharacterized protein n=1 Tax=Pseudomonas phage Touem01 TaxID=3138548 RepID=A0AAU6W2E9_9VIRU